MKIIRITTFLDFGGIERKMENLSTSQDEHEWIFVAINNGGEAENAILKNGKKVICLWSPYKIPQLGTIYKLFRLFKNEKPDVVHTSGAEANFHGIIAAKLAGVKVKIAEEIGIPRQSGFAKSVFKLVYQLADKILGESNLVVKNLIDVYRLSKEKVSVVHNFILFKNLKYVRTHNNDTFKMISVARLEAIKNIEMVLNVMPALLQKKKSLTFTIIGEGPHRQVLEKIIDKLNLKENVFLIGFKNDPYEFLFQADLYLLTSFTEGFSNSLLEAMYSGMPCLSTRVGAADEIFIDSKNGWIVEVNDKDELLGKLTTILQLGKIELSKIGMEGKKTVESKFSLDSHLSRLFSIYEN